MRSVPRIAGLLILIAIVAGCGGKKPTEPARCSVSHTSLDFGQVFIGQTEERSFSVANAGGGTLSGTIADTCGVLSLSASSYHLNGGESATFTVRFVPTSPETLNCVIRTDCGDSIVCVGRGVVAPACAVTPMQLDFGSVLVGSFADRSFTITNTGGGVLSGTVSGTCLGDNFTLVGSASYNLATGQSATMTLRFHPTTTGTVSCGNALAVGPGCAMVNAQGSGVVADVSTTNLDFGTIPHGTMSARSFTVHNVSSEAQTFIIDRCRWFWTDPRSMTISGGATGTFSAYFDASECGTQTCDLSVHLFGGAGVPIACTGSSAPSIDFGDVAVGQTVTRDVTVSAVPCSGPPTFLCLDGGTPDFIPSSLLCVTFSQSLPWSPTTFHVSFAPQTAGTKTCGYAIVSHCLLADHNDTLQFVCCRGNAFVAPGTPTCSLSATDVQFGTVSVGSSVDRSFTITNAGGGVLSGVVEDSDPFFVVGERSFGLLGGQSATITIRFKPSQSGLSFSNNVHLAGGLCPWLLMEGQSR